jgi:hypothetical protein
MRAQAPRIVEWVVPYPAPDSVGNPQENLSHPLKVAGSLVGGGEARLLVKRTQNGPRPELAVME